MGNAAAWHNGLRTSSPIYATKVTVLAHMIQSSSTEHTKHVGDTQNLNLNLCCMVSGTQAANQGPGPGALSWQEWKPYQLGAPGRSRYTLLQSLGTENLGRGRDEPQQGEPAALDSPRKDYTPRLSWYFGVWAQAQGL